MLPEDLSGVIPEGSGLTTGCRPALAARGEYPAPMTLPPGEYSFHGAGLAVGRGRPGL